MTQLATMSSDPSPLVALFWHLVAACQPLIDFVLLMQRVVEKLMENPYMGDMIRFLFLGTVMEAGRKMADRCSLYMTQMFVTKAAFNQGDLAYDWVAFYLDSHKLWGKSNEFRVVARDADRMRSFQGSTGAVNAQDSNTYHVRNGVIEKQRPQGVIGNAPTNGRPIPVYEPTGKTPEIFYWRGHWISVEKVAGSDYEYETGYELGGSLTLTVYAWNHSILRDLVEESRKHFDNSGKRPRLVEPRYDPCGVVLTAQFFSGDASYNWVMSWLMNKNLLQHSREVTVTTKQYATAWEIGGDPSLSTSSPSAISPSSSSSGGNAANGGNATISRGLKVRFSPPTDARQLFQWSGIWVQATVRPVPAYNSNGEGGQITLALHNSKHDKLVELIETARQEFMAQSASKINVHMTDSYYSWNKMITKSQRSLDTLILPEGVKESLLEDAKEFLSSAEWYNMTGVPHRRGYLLHGEPGTGKTSTIHALAGELGLEVYFMSLAAPAMNDSSLASLFGEVPSHAIILIEDIDCAFPSRDPDDDSDDELDFGDDDAEDGVELEDLGLQVPKTMNAKTGVSSSGSGGGVGGSGRPGGVGVGKGNGVGAGVKNGPSTGKRRRPRNMIPPKSSVTLAGLLNVLDGVTSEEGRIVFATTNHIENLDPALIRPGRMDVKVQYNLATREQIIQTFLRFYPVTGHVFGDPNTSFNPRQPRRQGSLPMKTRPTSSLVQIIQNKSRRDHHGLTQPDLDALAHTFADKIAPDTYSIAQIQGYLLTMKNNPLDAADDVKEWVEEQRRQKEHIVEIRRKRRLEAKRRKKEEQATMAAFMNGGGVGGGIGGGMDGMMMGPSAAGMFGMGHIEEDPGEETEEDDDDGLQQETEQPTGSSDGDLEMVTPPSQEVS